MPGIGDYTANVLLALIYNQPRIGIDGNVKRILLRLFNVNFFDLTNLFKIKRNADFAEALMEFGALICKPKDPKCYECSFKKICLYNKSQHKTKFKKKKEIKFKNYDIFCYLNKNTKQIALTKNNNFI